MHFLRYVAFVVGLAAATIAPAGARPSPTPTPAPTPTPVADPAVTKVVRQQFVAWQAGSINKSLYSADLIPKLTDKEINDDSRALSSLGPLTDATFVGPYTAADFPSGARGYIYQMRCTEGSVYMFLVIDVDGKIATAHFNNKLDVETIERPGTPPPASPHP